MNSSDGIKALAPALVAALQEIKNPPLGASNPHFRSKYASLPDCLKVAKDALHKHDLVLIQSVCSEGDRTGVRTRIVHKSGEWIESDPCYFKDRQDNAQGAGSCTTYARRYSLCAMLGIVGDDDDDGNAASGPGLYATMKADLAGIKTPEDMGAWKSAARAAWGDLTPAQQKEIDGLRKKKEAEING